MSISRAVIVLCTAVVLAHATSATAAPITLQLTSGATVVTVTDGGLGDVNPLADAITYVGSVGSWFLNASTGVGESVLGPATMDLSSLDIAAGAADPLIVSLTQVGVTAAANGFTMDFGGTISNGTVAYSAYADDSNTAFGLSQLIGTLGPFGTASFSGSASGPVAVTGPYSLTQVLTIQGARYGVTSYSGDAQLTPQADTEDVPEPASLALFGSGLSVLGVALRRRRQAAE